MTPEQCADYNRMADEVIAVKGLGTDPPSLIEDIRRYAGAPVSTEGGNEAA